MISNSEKHLHIIGTQINYYFICKTKLWLFSHHIQMEQESETVSLGKILHQKTYKDEKKDFVIDNVINVDFIKKGDVLEIHEVKKTSKMENAHKYQLLFYLYYLKREKGIENIMGVINYPKIRKKEVLILEKCHEEELYRIIMDMEDIISTDFPNPEKKKICLKCAYYEFCWV